MVGDENGDADRQHGQGAAFQADRHAVDDIRGVAGLAGFGHARHRRRGGVVFRNQADAHPDHAAGRHRPENPCRHGQDVHEKQRRDDERARGNESGVTQRVLRPHVLQRFHGEDAQKGRQEADNGHAERQRHQGVAQHGLFHTCASQLVPSVAAHDDRRADSDRRDDRAHVGLEDVGAHAGHVAYVVAYVVGDHARVARVIFGNACLDFPHQVAAHVRCFGVDAAADAREQGDGTGAHREPADVFGGLGVGVQAEEGPHAQQSEAGDGQAHDRAAVEGDQQSGAFALGQCGLRGAHVRLGGRLHAEIAGQDGTDRAGQKGDARLDGDLPDQQAEDDQHEDAQDLIFAFEKGHRAFVDRRGDFAHAVVPVRVAGHRPKDQERHGEPDHPENHGIGRNAAREVVGIEHVAVCPPGLEKSWPMACSGPGTCGGIPVTAGRKIDASPIRVKRQPCSLLQGHRPCGARSLSRNRRVSKRSSDHLVRNSQTLPRPEYRGWITSAATARRGPRVCAIRAVPRPSALR